VGSTFRPIHTEKDRAGLFAPRRFPKAELTSGCTLSTNRISQLLCLWDEQQLLDDLRQVCGEIGSAAPGKSSRLEPGQWVRVRYGPFHGFQGKILQRRGGVRVLIALTFLGISIEIDNLMLEQV
jgi:transcription antitermination factor NusG